jgi:hypothetical protein
MKKCLMMFLVSGLVCAQEEFIFSKKVSSTLGKDFKELSEEERNNVTGAFDVVAVVDEGGKRLEAESKPSTLCSLSCGAVGVLPALGLYAWGEIKGHKSMGIEFFGIAVVATGALTWLGATKGAEWLAGWWNGSRKERCDQAKEHIAAKLKGESVSEKEFKAALELAKQIAERGLKKRRECLKRLELISDN